MTDGNGRARRAPVGAAALCVVTATVVLASGCGESNGRTGTAGRQDNGSPAAWTEPDGYRYTLSLFDGACGEKEKAGGSWEVIVADGTATRAEPLDAVARDRSWPEGAPTIGELLDNALGVRADGAYDVVDIEYAGNGTHPGRPVRIHYLDRDEKNGGYESCEVLHDFVPETWSAARPALVQRTPEVPGHLWSGATRSRPRHAARPLTPAAFSRQTSDATARA